MNDQATHDARWRKENAAYKALLFMNSKLMKANQQLVEALIAKNATDYALAQHFIQRMGTGSESKPQAQDQSPEEALKGVVDEASLAASDVG